MEESNRAEAIFSIQDQYLKKGWSKINTQKKQTISTSQLEALIKYVFKKNKQRLQLQMEEEDMDILQIIQGFKIERQCQEKQQFTIQEALEIMNWAFEQSEQGEQVNAPQKLQQADKSVLREQNGKIKQEVNIESQKQKEQLKKSHQQSKVNKGDKESLTVKQSASKIQSSIHDRQNNTENQIKDKEQIDNKWINQNNRQQNQQDIAVDCQNQLVQQGKLDDKITSKKKQTFQNKNKNQQNQPQERKKQIQNDQFGISQTQTQKSPKKDNQIEKKLSLSQNIVLNQGNKEMNLLKLTPQNKIVKLQQNKKNYSKNQNQKNRIPLQVRFYPKQQAQSLKIEQKPKLKKLNKSKAKKEHKVCPKQGLRQIFQFYCLINNQSSTNKQTFDTINNAKNIMNLHKFMLFSKDFLFLNYKKSEEKKQVKNQERISKLKLQQIQQEKTDNFPIKQIIDAEQQRKRIKRQEVEQKNSAKIKEYQQKIQQNKIKLQKQHQSLQKQKIENILVLDKSSLSVVYKKATNYSQQMTFQAFIQVLLKIQPVIKCQQLKKSPKQGENQPVDQNKINNQYIENCLNSITNFMQIQTDQQISTQIKRLKIFYKKVQKQETSKKLNLSKEKKITQINGKFKQNIQIQLKELKKNRQKNHQNLKDKYLMKYEPNHLKSQTIKLKMPSLHSGNNTSATKQIKYKQFSVNNVLKQAKMHLSQNVPNHFGNSRLRQQGQTKSFVLRKKAVTIHKNSNTQILQQNCIGLDQRQNNSKNPKKKLGYTKLSQLEFQNNNSLQIYNQSKLGQKNQGHTSRFKQQLTVEQNKEKQQYLRSMGVAIEKDDMLQQYLQQQQKTNLKRRA